MGLARRRPGHCERCRRGCVFDLRRVPWPHLVALLVRARNENRVWEAATAWAEVGLDLAVNALHVDDILTVGKGLLKTARILFGVVSDEPVNEAQEQPLARSEAVLLDLEKVFDPKATGQCSMPVRTRTCGDTAIA
jgi:hypothetical protein